MTLETIETNLSNRLKRQREYLVNGKGRFLFFGIYTEGRRELLYSPYGHQVDYLSDVSDGDLQETHVKKYAFELGVRIARNVKVQLENQMHVEDDSCPSPYWLNMGIDIGVGNTTSLFTGQDVVFQKMTSYNTDYFLENWDDFHKLKFNPDNRFIQYELEIWRGMASEYIPGLPVITHQLRSPLDLANALRGNQLFVDLYDAPDKVDQLLDACAGITMEYERFMRSEISVLRDAPGGCCGVALPQPGMLFINGDPIDLINPEMGDRFNKPFVEKLAAAAGSIYFHHHSIGLSRASNVSKIAGVTVQEIAQDPTGPRLIDNIESFVEPSKSLPIHLHMGYPYYDTDFSTEDEIREIVDRMGDGRFIFQMRADTAKDLNKLIAFARSYAS